MPLGEAAGDVGRPRRVADFLLPAAMRGHGPLLVARGDIEASVFLSGGPWDHAPFVVIVEEAGGRYSDLWGGRRIDTATALFTSGAVHDDPRGLAFTGAPLSLTPPSGVAGG